MTLAVALAWGGASLGVHAQALPTGGQVTLGGASISQTAPNAMLVKQATDKAAINWQTFNIGAGNSVRFDQPSASSIALNRVIGGSRSEIYGNLSSNGQVFLVNPNGVLFGPSAQVDVGSLVASTLNITDKNFLDGNYVFSDPGNAGSVVNQGKLTARGNGSGGGYLALIGSQVSNTGTMQAQLGSVVLGAGGTAQLTLADSKLIKFEVQQGALDALAENGGLIQAGGGQVILRAGAVDELLKSTVNNTGVIEAQTVQGQPGNILLLAGMKSGTTNVGGTLDASAPNGGNGGFIETSAATVNIADSSRVTTAASAGLMGTWLIDPTDFTVAPSGGNVTGAYLSSALSGNANMIISSGNSGTSGSGDVNINDNISWSADQWLTITAAHSINIRGVITLGGSSHLIMNTSSANYGQAAIPGGTINTAVSGGGGFAGRVDMPGRSGLGILWINGQEYTVINSVGSWRSTGNDLQGIGRSDASVAGYYALGSDIDASATAGWKGDLFSNGFIPIATRGNAFTGTLDGLGHTIRNLAVANSSYHGTGNYGLFATIGNGGVVQNLGLVGGGLVSGASLHSVSNLGGIAGRSNGGIFRNVFNTGSVAYTGPGGAATAGGLVGEMTGGAIINGYGTGNVSGYYAGGLVGMGSGTIANSYTTGSISGAAAAGGLGGSFSGTITNSSAFGNVNGASSAGGLVGESIYGGSISTSHAHGTVTGATSGSSIVGGLIGNAKNVYISNSFATGNVTSPNAISGSIGGGLVGRSSNGGSISSSYATGNVNSYQAGGLVGFTLQTGSISNSFASGNVNGVNGVGGLVGVAQNMAITNTYATGRVSGNSYVGGLVGDAGAAYGISFSFANNVVTGSQHVGGLVGAGNQARSARSLFWNTTLSGQSQSGFSGPPQSASDPYSGANGLTATQMLQASSYPLRGTFTDWSISSSGGAGTVWRIYDGHTTPLLESFLTPLTITANNVTKVYDATSVGLTNVSYSPASAAGSSHLYGIATPYGNVTKNNVGTYAASIWSDQFGYDITLNGGNLTVTPATLTASGLAAQNKVYDGTTTATLTGSLGGIKGSDSVAFTTATFTSKNVGNGIAVTGVGITGSDAGNYTLSGASALSANITPATLTVTASSANRTYGAANPAFTGNVTGFVNGETLATATTGTEIFSSAATLGSNVGTYSITGSGLTANNGNYVFAQAAGNSSALTINPATLTVTANSANRTYGAANPAFTGSVTGFVNGDTLATATTGTEVFSTTATTGSNVGTYSITGSGLTANNGNYVFTQAAGNSSALTINPATLTVTANSASRLYGAANPVFSGTVTGFVNGQTLATATTGTEVFSTTATTGSNVGTYSITGSGLVANNGNYVFAQAAGNSSALTINPATLTVTANSTSRTYGAANPILTGSVTGFVNGDTLATATTGTEVFSTLATTGSNVGSYGITGAGLSANNGNYVFVQAPSNTSALTINPATLTVTANTANRTYGDANPVLTGSVTGFVNGDTLATATTGSEVFSTAATTGSNVGNYGISGAGLTANNGNYVFVQAPGNTSALTITPATLTVTANAASRAYGAADPAFSGSVTGFVNGDTLATATTGTEVFSTNAQTLSNVGSYGITGSGLAANHGNYVFTQAPSNASALTINPAVLTVSGLSLAGTTRVYDGSNTMALTGTGVLSGLVGGQTLTLGNYATLAGPDVGSQAVTRLVSLGDGSNGGLASNYTLAPPAVPNVTITQLASATWVGGSSGNWSNPANWAPSANLAAVGAVPTLSNVAAVVIPANVAVTYDNLPGNTVLSTLNAGSGGAFTFNGGSLSVGGGSMNLASLTMNSGLLNMGAGVNVGSYIQNGGTWTQVSSTLPAFSANNFSFGGGTFLRALGGDGSSAAPYRLTDIYGVQGMRGLSSSSYVLANDIDATGTANWNGGAGFLPMDFNGSLDGQGHSVNGITINSNRSDSVGFFSRIGYSGAVSNFGVRGGTVSGGGAYLVGGLAGANYGTISNSYSTADVNGNYYVGGLVGINFGTISKTYATGRVTGAAYVGGLVGYNISAVSDSYATGAVQLTNYGYYAGGLVGFDGGTITKSYATGLVSGGVGAGGLGAFAGQGSGSGYGNFYDKSVNPGMTGAYGMPDTAGTLWGLSTADMRNRSNFTSATAANGGVNPGWDLTGTWLVYEGHTAPLLRPFLRPLTVTVNDATKTYDGLASAGGNGVRYSSTPDANLLGTPNYSGSGTNAGTYALSADGLYSNQDGYIISYVPGTLTINPATLTVTANAASRTYGSANPAVLSGTVTGFVNGDTLATATTGTEVFSTTATLGSNVGSYDITGSGLTVTNNNYVLVQAPGNASALTVTPATLTVTANSASRTYGAANPAMSGTVTGFVNGQTLATATTGTEVFSSSATGTSNVGAYDIVGAGLTANNGNYVFVQAPGNTGALTVMPAPLTVTASNASKVYGQTPVLTGFTSSGLQNGETIGSVTETSAGTAATAGVAGGPYVITASNATGGTFSAGNYLITYANGALSVTPAPLTVSGITVANKVYDQTTAATVNTGGVSYIGLLNGDTVTISATGTFSDKNAGTGKTVNLTSSYGGADVGNYTITGQATATADITPKALSVGGITAGNKIYDQTTSATVNTGGATYTGLIGGDAVTVSATGTFSDKNAGTGKTVNLSSTYSGADAGNYSITDQATTTANITPATLTVSGITANNKVYDQTTAATVNTGGASYAGLFSGDTVTVSATGTFSDKNAGIGKTVNLSSTYSGADAGNYTITGQTTATADITPKALSVGGITAGNKVYDQTTLATVNTGGATYTGLIGGDVVAVSATGTFSDKNAGTGKTVNLSSTYSGADAGNYSITDQATTTANITPAALTVSGITAGNKVYDQTTAATVNTGGVSYAGLFSGDTVTVSATGTFSDKNAGIGKTVNLSSTYSGADAGNYTITGQTTATADITPKALSVGGITAGNKVYDQTTSATVNTGGATYTGLIGGDAVTVSATGTFSDKNAAVGKTVNLSSTYSGADVGNYTITNQATASADITPAALTVSGITANNKVYDQTTAATVNTGGASYAGLFSGDAVTVNATGTFSDKNAAIGKTVTLSSTYGGADAGNYTITNQATTTADITPKALSVGGITAGNKVYDQTTSATVNTGGATYTGLISGDAVTVSATGTFSDKNAGTGKTVNLSSTYSGADVGNYTITNQATASANITPASLTISGITAASKVYDGTATATVNTGAAVYGGLIAGDTVTVGATGTFSDKNAAVGKTVILSSSYGGADAGNYSITGQASTSADITPKAATVTAGNVVKTYGSTYSFSGGEFSATGLISGETIGSVSLVSTGAASGAIVAGNPYAVTASGATGGSFSASNYSITYVDGSLTVNRAPLTITANPYSKTYDGIAYSGGNGISYTGYVNGETGSVLSGQLTYGGSAQGAVDAGSYAITPGGLSAANYAISYVNGALVINSPPPAPPANSGGLPSGAQGAVNTAQQTGAGSNGTGGGAADGLGGSAGGSSQGVIAQNDGSQNDSNQSAAAFPPAEEKDRDAGKSGASRQVLFTIVGPGQKLPEGVQ